MRAPRNRSLLRALLVGAPMLLAALGALAKPDAARPWVLQVDIIGSINPGSAAQIIETIHEGETRGAELVLIRLDTPGGLLAATRDIVQTELSSKVPVVVWVGPPGARAGSAGVFITLAANVAAMAPATNIGAAHPVSPLGDNKKPKEDEADKDDIMARKLENDTAAFVTGIAERRQRNVEWAEKSVRESISVVSNKALEAKVIDLIVEDIPELLQKLDGRKVTLAPGDVRELHTAGAEIRQAGWSVKNRFLNFLADPEIAFLIAMLGVICVLAELYHPGLIAPGVTGAICLIIAGVAFQMLPVNAGALLLLAGGAILCGVEFFVGGHGGFIAAGAVCIVVGGLLLIGHVNADFFADSDFGLSWRMVAPAGLLLGGYSLFLMRQSNKVRTRPQTTGKNVLIGRMGEVREAIAPEATGTVLVNGELWKAKSDAALPVGARVQVLSVEGFTVLVQAA
ncbi:MAG: nodulation protein NfeD [Deltaproteobacteria bacterium]|nr:nodulation protein NfeD [Deltaproteobacteria bacterium]